MASFLSVPGAVEPIVSVTETKGIQDYLTFSFRSEEAVLLEIEEFDVRS